MKMLESVQKALKWLKGSFINHNNEIILIPKFNVYTLLDDVNTDDDFKVKLCEWFSRDCCCALRYSQKKRLDRYYQENTEAFNYICGTNFTVEQMEYIYTYLGNGIRHNVAEMFVKSGFDLSVIEKSTHQPRKAVATMSEQELVNIIKSMINLELSLANHKLLR